MNNNQEQFETHPFAPFVPLNASVLILGSFPGKDANKEGDWYYSAIGNQFWNPILKTVFSLPEILIKRKDKESLFESNGIAISDIILSVKRKNNNNQDSNLIPKAYNKEIILDMLQRHPIEKILCTSKGVLQGLEKHILNDATQDEDYAKKIQNAFIEKLNGYQKIIKPIVKTFLLNNGKDRKINAIALPSPGSPWRQIEAFGGHKNNWREYIDKYYELAIKKNVNDLLNSNDSR